MTDILSLHQCHLGVEPVHEQRRDDAEREIDDRSRCMTISIGLAGLVEDRAADGDEIRDSRWRWPATSSWSG